VALGRKPAYVYRFVHDLPGGDGLGAWHSCELWYMFGTLGRCWRDFTEKDYTLSERMLDYWSSFMKTGDPNCGSWATWQPCSGAEGFVMELDV
jgi:para-nitrobenzyl esterase